MPWYRVEIPESDVAADSATALMEKFAEVYLTELFSEPPTGISVHHRAEDGYIYYFSPGASKLVPELLREWNATACATDPDLSGFEEIRI